MHHHLAIPEIYDKLGWTITERDEDVARDMDINHGIDYVLQDQYGRRISVQERFRESTYAKYNDATLRFRRDQNKHADRVESESYKIKADYLVYGICNGKKATPTGITTFLKWVVVDIKFLQQKFREGLLLFASTGSIYCRQDGNKMICPENKNPDGSSSFRPFDVRIMYQLWGDEPILAQQGFL